MSLIDLAARYQKNVMENKTKSKFGVLLFGVGGVSAFFGLLCCGLPWVFAGLFAALGLGFLFQDAVLMSIAILGIIVAFIGWRILKK